jgi:hypothetical protein
MIKAALKRVLYKVFAFGQRVGVDVLPRHFYSQIPDLRSLARTDTWRTPMSMFGVNGAEIETQAECFSRWMARADAEPVAQEAVYATACAQNGASGYGPTEAQIWFRMVLAVRPKQIVQIGAGVSTAIALQALGKRADALACAVTAIDPFPTDYLKRLAASGEIALRHEPAQRTPMAVFEGLNAGDVLFIDSTHTVSPGSEVNYLILEVLPRLKPGVLVHFHDIYFPYDYQRNVLNGELFFQSETTLLQAFLVGNARYTIEFALSAMHYAKPECIKRYVPSYTPAGNRHGLAAAPIGHFPSAVYLRVLGD